MEAKRYVHDGNRHEFEILNNYFGSHTFIINGNGSITIFTNDRSTYNITEYKDIYIAQDEKYNGYCNLIAINDKTYIYVGQSIFSFQIEGAFKGFYCELGPNFVPYAYIKTDIYYYTLTGVCKIKIDKDIVNPYDYACDHLSFMAFRKKFHEMYPHDSEKDVFETNFGDQSERAKWVERDINARYEEMIDRYRFPVKFLI
jgi:hypothetical protein